MLFKKFFIRLKTRQAIRSSTVSRDNISFKDAGSVGIIYSWDGKRKAEIITRFANELEQLGKHVRVLCFSRVDLNVVPVKVDFISDTDFSYFGQIKGEKLKAFIDQRFDFLFHMDTQENAYIEQIMVYSQARCRVSRADFRKKDFYDFMIQTHGNLGIDNLCNEILHYTKSLVNNV